MRPRVIFLGASNLTRGVAHAAAAARAAVGAPCVEYHIAYGHGRSYGIDTTILGRTLPGIVNCRLWDAIDRPAPTCALITDIGNDIMYGQPIDDIVEWVSLCIDRLRRAGARIAMTALPIERLEVVSEREFRIARRILFPRNTMSFEDALDRARALNRHLELLAEHDNDANSLALVRPDPAWYGIDPIHIRFRDFSWAWSAIFAPWNGRAADRTLTLPPIRAAIDDLLRVRLARPQQVRFLGREAGEVQPAARLRCGSLVHLY